MNEILLDTHVWIWYANGSDELNKKTRKIITDSLHAHSVYLPAISLWEISMLDKRERIILEIPCLEWINKSIALTHLQIAPLTPAIAVESCNLPGTFHDDPADRLIVATARIEGFSLVTRDQKILAYSSNKYLTTIKA